MDHFANEGSHNEIMFRSYEEYDSVLSEPCIL